jgi:hypothetical protein
MTLKPYQHLQALSKQVANTLPRPLFYLTFGEDIRRSEDLLRNHGRVAACRTHLDESLLECAHGLCHCESVARDAGAIVLIEGRARGLGSAELDRLAESAVIAGLLHDIKRREEDHAVRGSIEAERILNEVGIERRFREYIVYAIRNHEAFKQTCDLGDAAGCMVSDALYDADKFRWGPENFTTTLWTIVDSRGTPPERLHGVFPEKMQGIERIKETFRTATGRTYGPEIIDQGLLIGNAIYREMCLRLDRGWSEQPS